MDQELIAYLDKRFGEVNERFDEVNGRFQEIDERFREVNQYALETRIEIEDLRGMIQKVAEGVAGNTEQIASFRTEVSEKLEEMQLMFNASHSNLHRRVNSLEAWHEKAERRL